jgi:hypothetical protein
LVIGPREYGVGGVEGAHAGVSLSVGGVGSRGHVSSVGAQPHVTGAIGPLPSRDGVVDADAGFALPGG